MTSKTIIETTPTLQTSYLTASDSYNYTNNTYPHCEHFKVINNVVTSLITILYSFVKLFKFFLNLTNFLTYMQYICYKLQTILFKTGDSFLVLLKILIIFRYFFSDLTFYYL